MKLANLKTELAECGPIEDTYELKPGVLYIVYVDPLAFDIDILVELWSRPLPEDWPDDIHVQVVPIMRRPEQPLHEAIVMYQSEIIGDKS